MVYGIGGGIAAGAATGVLCGPGASVCVTIGFFARLFSRALGAMGADMTFGWLF